ncbi:hypothetical protein CEXT_228361, partial [Caerostris extrusa]
MKYGFLGCVLQHSAKLDLAEMALKLGEEQSRDT